MPETFANPTESSLAAGAPWPGPPAAPSSQADRLARRLAAEFEAPVGILAPGASAWRAAIGAPIGAFPPRAACRVVAAADGPVGEGRVIVWRDYGADGPSWLVFPVGPAEAPGPATAWVGFRPIGAATPAVEGVEWGPPCPDRALIAWGGSVADRLRPGESPSRLAPATVAPAQRPVTDRLTRRLRVSDPPERFQELAVRTLRDVLGVGAVAWVPATRREPVILGGTIAGLTAEMLREPFAAAPSQSVWVANNPAPPMPAAVRRLAAVAGDRDASAGWLVAMNPVDDRPLADPEIELLQPVASLIGVQRANARHYAELKDLLLGVIRALTAAIDAKDPYTLGHSERVARIAVRLAEQLGRSATERGDLYLMGLLHDVGKIGVDDSILKKPAGLTPDEVLAIRSHVQIGVNILADLKKLNHLLPGVAHHHESLDGTGYPDGLAGDAIPLPARILAVADAYDAMSSTRPYRRRLSPGQIDAIFQKGAGVQWDARVVDALFACRADLDRIRQKGLGESLRVVVDDTLGRG